MATKIQFPATISPPVFQASWNRANQHLRVYPQSRLEAIGHFFWNVISVLVPVILVIRIIGWCVSHLSKKATVPAAIHYSPEQLQEIRDIFNTYCFGPINRENQDFRKAYTTNRHIIKTPDGANLSALHFQHKQSGPDTPTVIYFQPNLALSELFIHSWLMQEMIKRDEPCNFLVCDYRAASSATASTEAEFDRPEQLILDGDAVYQFARDSLHIDPDLLIGYGWSLGGAVLANVKAIHPEWQGRFVSERSFSSTGSVVSHWLKGALKVLMFWFPCAMRWTEWDFKAPINRVNGRKMIVYSTDDQTIRYGASCHREAIRTRTAFESVRITANSSLRLAEIAGFSIYHHAHPISDYVVATHGNRPANEVIADFILDQAAALQQIPVA